MWRIAGFTGAVGIEVALAIAIGYFGGHWLDRKLGTGPVLSFIGFAAGVGAAIKALVRVTRDYQKKLSNDDKTEQYDSTTTPDASTAHPGKSDPHGH